MNWYSLFLNLCFWIYDIKTNLFVLVCQKLAFQVCMVLRGVSAMTIVPCELRLYL